MATLIRTCAVVLLAASMAVAGENWTQFKYDARRSGDAGDRQLTVPLQLVAAAPLGDAVFTAPVVADGLVCVVDGAGTAWCFDCPKLQLRWKFDTKGGAVNCNNTSSPAIAEGYLHFGTMAGWYYVLDRRTGKLVREIDCGEPIFSSPVVSGGRVYFATLGGKVHALRPDGTQCWSWDYVTERLKFQGNRWSAADWLKHKGGNRVTWRDQFVCAREIAAYGNTLVAPIGGEIVWLEDAGEHPRMKAATAIPPYAGSERAADFGTSIGPDGTVYQQWHRRDNTGRVETLRLVGEKIVTGHVPGTLTAQDMPDSLGFCSVSIRGNQVFRCRPEEGSGLRRYAADQQAPEVLCAAASIASPVLVGQWAVYGGLDGRLYVAPLAGQGKPWSFATAFGKPITAPACVCDGHIYFGCEDGYLYVLGPQGTAPLPTDDLQLTRIRTPPAGKLAGAEHDWYTTFGDFANTNCNRQGIEPPLKLKWIRRYEGTFKHLPVCGGGRMYTHTAEGQIFAVEQETGRLLWRRFFPGVHACFTAPLYYKERLLVPQAGLDQAWLRCLDAATGKLLWQAPFSGSPSWNRPQPPVIYKNLAIYMFSSGKYAAKGTGIFVMRMGPVKQLPDSNEGISSWLFSNDNPFYPRDHRPLVRAYDLQTGQIVWTQDFSRYGSGGDHAGLCLLGDRLYYSCFFGYAARDQQGRPSPNGITAALDPLTGNVKWLTTQYSTTGGCAISGAEGRLYLGGYNQPHLQTEQRYIHCLDARDGSLLWRSEPIRRASNVVTVGPRWVFAAAYGGDSYLVDKHTGKITQQFSFRYACTRFSLSFPYLLGTNCDLIDVSDGAKLVSTGPPLDPRECVGAVASNGRLHFTAQAGGMQACQIWGKEAAACADRVPPPIQSENGDGRDAKGLGRQSHNGGVAEQNWGKSSLDCN